MNYYRITGTIQAYKNSSQSGNRTQVTPFLAEVPLPSRPTEKLSGKAFNSGIRVYQISGEFHNPYATQQLDHRFIK